MKRALNYLRKLTDDNNTQITPEQYDILLSVLRSFDSDDISAADMYDIVMDEDSVFGIAMSAEETVDSKIMVFWQAVESVLCCLICKAYQNEGQKHLPQDIESIQAEKLDGFFHFLDKNCPSVEECYEYFCREICL